MNMATGYTKDRHGTIRALPLGGVVALVEGDPQYADYMAWLAAGNEPEVPLEEAKAIALEEAAWVFNTLVSEGFTYDGAVYQMDDASRVNISALGSSAGLASLNVGAPWPAEFAFRAADNSWVPMTATEVVAFANTARDAYMALRVKYAGLKDAIAAAESTQAVQAIDIAAAFA